MRKGYVRIGWFVALWLMSVTTLAIAASIIRWFLIP